MSNTAMSNKDSNKPAMTPQQALLTEERGSALAIYKDIAVGKRTSLAAWVYYEFCTTVLSGLPGLLGFGTRAVAYPALFAACGPKPAIGRGVLLRNPGSISIGKKLLLDDYAVLDARGEDASICVGDFVSIGRFTTIAAKNAQIMLGRGCNLGSYCRIASQSKIEIGESALIAAYCYIGPGNHQSADAETPLISREMEIKGGVKIGAHAWIGARSTILDGVTIGDGAIVGAHSLVLSDVPAGAVAVGSPARIIRAA